MGSRGFNVKQRVRICKVLLLHTLMYVKWWDVCTLAYGINVLTFYVSILPHNYEKKDMLDVCNIYIFPRFHIEVLFILFIYKA